MNKRQVYINIVCKRLEAPYFLTNERLGYTGATRLSEKDLYRIYLGREKSLCQHYISKIINDVDAEVLRVKKLMEEAPEKIIEEYNALPITLSPETRDFVTIPAGSRGILGKKVLEYFAYKYCKDVLDSVCPDGDEEYVNMVNNRYGSRTELRKRAYILYKVCKKFRAPELCEPLLASEGLSPVSYKPYMYGTLLDSAYKGLVDEEIQGRSDIVVGCDHMAIMEEIYAKIGSHG